MEVELAMVMVTTAMMAATTLMEIMLDAIMPKILLTDVPLMATILMIEIV